MSNARSGEFSDVTKELNVFSQGISFDQKVLAVVGGGTAALTYLYTADIEPNYTHILILGERGYWGHAGHRLAQPHHIFALPHRASDEFVDSAEQDAIRGVLPDNPRSAYVHSNDFQDRLIDLEKATLEALIKKGKKIHIERKAQVKKIERVSPESFRLEINNSITPLIANKIIIATGAGPARKLPTELNTTLLASAEKNQIDASAVAVRNMILDYTDVLRPVVEKCKGKDVLIYGGGATAAWAMEVAAFIAKPLAWVAKNGFDKAIVAGPRVGAIIEGSRSLQVHGSIDALFYEKSSITGAIKLVIKVVSAGSPASETSTTYYKADYLFNCIGQEPYDIGGLPEIISPRIKSELHPHVDKNNVMDSLQPTMLGWSTPNADLMIIGAAQGTYYDRDRKIEKPASVSQFLPRSGQVGITIGSVVASVCGLTNYMPFTQDAKTGVVTQLSLNVNMMNATQLAVYFTSKYPEATISQVNVAVKFLIISRTKTEFGLSETKMSEFLARHFSVASNEPVYQVKRLNLFSSSSMQKPIIANRHLATANDSVMSASSSLTNRFFHPTVKKSIAEETPDSFVFVSSAMNNTHEKNADIESNSDSLTHSISVNGN